MLGLFLAVCHLSGQQDSAPAGRMAPVEARAVWIATVRGLDWPKSTETAQQKAALRGMLADLAARKFNIVFFQVRGRGDAMYRPGLEPWSAVLTGKAGGDPGWDPLAFVVAEGHALGLQVHAWFNTYFLGAGRPPSGTTPPHIAAAHPGWAVRYNDELWLDPGRPEVNRYLASVTADIARRYEIDGILFDYARYPGRLFADDGTYREHGGGASRDDWRRANVTAFMAAAAESARAVRPSIVVGATPLGIYRNPPGVRGLEAYSEVFQDSREWLKRGILDYAAPQIYWPAKPSGSDPPFGLIARDWKKNSHGKLIYGGIGAYKPEVFVQLAEILDSARGAVLDGHAFFRYSNILPSLPGSPRYVASARVPERPPVGPAAAVAASVAGTSGHAGPEVQAAGPAGDGSREPPGLRIGAPTSAVTLPGTIFVPYEMRGTGTVTITVLRGATTLLTAPQGEKGTGRYVAALDVSRLPPGEYECVVRSDGASGKTGFALPARSELE